MKTLKRIYRLLFTCSVTLALAACTDGDRFDFGKEVILVTGTDVDPLVRFVVEEAPATYTVTASATGKVAEDVTVNFVQDNAMVDRYNQENGTNYHAVPSNMVSLSGNTGVIAAGSASSTGVDVQITSTDGFVDGRTYIIPVSIQQVSGGGLDVLESSRTIYLRLARVSNFYSLDMNNPNLYSNYIFPDEQAVNLSRYTYEIKCYINDWHTTPEQISRLCSFTSKDEQRSNMLRFGENGQDINSLQWVNPAGSLISKTRFNTGQWYTISLTYDGSKLTMYVDGERDGELAGSGECTFQRFELGMSWANYPRMQYFNGRVAEVRVWERDLSGSEIRLGLCGVDPASEDLVAYWKFNESEGHIFHDATGNGYDMDWSNTVRDNAGNGTLNTFDKSAEVNWLFDEQNKCTQ